MMSTPAFAAAPDNFQCYQAADIADPAFLQRDVSVADELQSKTFTVLTPKALCTPTDKDSGGVGDATAHLVCYLEKQAKGQDKFVGTTLHVADEFGELTLDLKKAKQVCLPSEKNGTASVLAVDQFQCYGAKAAKGGAKFAKASAVLTDAFSSATVTVIKPMALCLPVIQAEGGALDPDSYRTCYKIAPGQNPAEEDVTTNNVFGAGALAVKKRGTLCVPSSRIPCESEPHSVFVSASLGDDTTGTGSKAAPVRTIQHGIEVASERGVSAVCLSGESYNESVQLESGISLYGGYDQNDPEFAHSAALTTTVTASGAVVTAERIDDDTHIQGLTIHASTPTAPGASTYGILLRAGTATLYLERDTIVAAAGRAGAAGASGAVRSPVQATGGNSGTNGEEAISYSGIGGAAPVCAEPGGKGGDGGNGGNSVAGGQAGSNGSGGALGGAGSAVGPCISNAAGSPPPGGAGQPGGSGNGGTSGNGGSPGTATSAGYVPNAGGPGAAGSNGRGGGGGGGGGGGAGGGFCVWDKGGGGGSGGCGGLGGNQGAGGGGGGGSFGVFALAGTVIVSDGTTIATGSGGAGGHGGDGTAGQTGGAGGQKGLGHDDSAAGGVGGVGGSGGVAGAGGGGSGGPSTCVATTASAAVTFDSAFCTFGASGAGAAGGTNVLGASGGGGGGGGSAPSLVLN